MKASIIIAGALAQKPRYGGHTWALLQYVLGFKRLGCDVLFVDHLQPEQCVNDKDEPCSLEDSANLSYFMKTMDEFDLRESYALLYGSGERVIGMSRSGLLDRASRADVLINVMGYIRDEELLGRVGKLVFLDIDPGFGQMWQELDLCTMFNGHDCYVTIGENIGRPNCSIPTCGLQWITMHQPIHLDYWKPFHDTAKRGFTTIASWRGPYDPIEFQGKTYGLRVHEFRKIAALPRSCGERFELALNIHPADSADRILLETNGWNVIEPMSVSCDPWRYQSFIQESAAEIMVAKNIYVETQSGWFSDRSGCYLASGKPVLAQDTGLSSLYPIGEGLLTFTSLDGAIAGVEEISRNYSRHAQAARDIAEEYFDSSKVLRNLMDKIAQVPGRALRQEGLWTRQ
jgi:hypothetical protein